MSQAPPLLDDKVVTADATGFEITAHRESDNMPPSPTFKLKGVAAADGADFTRAGGVITWMRPISIFATVEVWDGSTLHWRWCAADGDLVGA